MTGALSGSARITRTFDELRRQGRMALIPYLIAGYPTLERSLELIGAVSSDGADLLEIGVPFSDPVADGRTIQSAGQVALANGFCLRTFLAAIAADPPMCPTLLMSYLNPLLAYGPKSLMADMARIGLVGLIIPDLPPEEANEWCVSAAVHGLSIIFFVAPTSSNDRILHIAGATDGFLYAVSVTGTTGARRELDPALPDYLRRIRRLTSKPVAVGFGISTPHHVRSLRGLADGVVIGSRLVDAIQNGESVYELIRVLKDATRE
jgi:tryptophan synthase alpha chain